MVSWWVATEFCLLFFFQRLFFPDIADGDGVARNGVERRLRFAGDGDRAWGRGMGKKKKCSLRKCGSWRKDRV